MSQTKETASRAARRDTCNTSETIFLWTHVDTSYAVVSSSSKRSRDPILFISKYVGHKGSKSKRVQIG